MKNRMLITLEGGEGGGKTTQAALLQQKLVRAGYEVVELREPGGTVISEQIREVVLATRHSGKMHVATEVFLFQAARAQIYHELIIPALEQEKIVVMDRSSDSSVVYQGIVRGFGKETISQLNQISTHGVKPTMTILLDLPAELGLQRTIAIGQANRMEMESLDFHHQVRQAYLELAKTEPERWKIIDASESIDQVAEKVWEVVRDKLKI